MRKVAAEEIDSIDGLRRVYANVILSLEFRVFELF